MFHSLTQFFIYWVGCRGRPLIVYDAVRRLCMSDIGIHLQIHEVDAEEANKY